MIAALYGVGLEPGDRYFCPSSPAWGHGLAHGTLSPLALGIAVGAYSGRFDASRLREALTAFASPISPPRRRSIACCASRVLSGRTGLRLTKATYTGEPMDAATWDWIEQALGSHAVRDVRQHGGRRHHRELSGLRGLPGAPRRARPRGARLGGRGGGRGHAPAGARRPARRDRRPAQGRVVSREGPRVDGRRGLHPSRRSLRRHHHLGGLDTQRARDRAGATRPSRGPRGRGHRRARRAARPGAPGVDRGAPRTTTRSRPSCRSTSAPGSGRHEFPRHVRFVDALPRTPAGKVDRHALRTRSQETP